MGNVGVTSLGPSFNPMVWTSLGTKGPIEVTQSASTTIRTSDFGFVNNDVIVGTQLANRIVYLLLGDFYTTPPTVGELYMLDEKVISMKHDSMFHLHDGIELVAKFWDMTFAMNRYALSGSSGANADLMPIDMTFKNLGAKKLYLTIYSGRYELP